MELASIFEKTLGEFAGQGIMFWSAAGAVALGVTLILASGFIQVRKIRRKSDLPVIQESINKPDPEEIPRDIELDREMMGMSREISVEPVSMFEEPNPGELRILQARLRFIADRLEDHQLSRPEMPAQTAESSLKETPAGVDYLFRTGTG